MAYFRVLKGLSFGKEFPLVPGTSVMGRSSDCEIVLEVPSVSRRHAKVTVNGDRVVIDDMGSRNGTFVNGNRIMGQVELNEGDQVQLCDLFLIYHRGAPEEHTGMDIMGAGTSPRDSRTKSSDSDSQGRLPFHFPKFQEVSEAVRGAWQGLRDDLGAMGSGLESDSIPGFVNSTQNDEIVNFVDDKESSIQSSFCVNPFQTNAYGTVRDGAKLKALLQLMQSLGQNLDLDIVMEKTLDSLFLIFPQADHGIIVLRHSTADRLVPKAVKHRRPTKDPMRISRTVFNNVIDNKTAILSADVMEDSRFNEAQSVVNMSIRSMMCAPLIDAEGQVLGAIKLDSDTDGHRFQSEDLELLASVAVQAAMYVRNAMLHDVAVRDAAIQRELTLAHKVQKALLPDNSPVLPGYSFYDIYRPARFLGGDYYDYVPLPDGRQAIVQADVAGKGITASLVMAKMSADTKFTLMSTPDPVEAVVKLNQIVCSKDLEGKFVTFVLITLDPKTHRVQIVNAGHNAPILRKPGGEVVLMKDIGDGLPLGIMDDSPYSLTELTLEPEEMLFFYTDGLTDAMNLQEEFFSIDRVLEKISRPAEEIQQNASRLIADLIEYIGAAPQTDDICVVGFQRHTPTL